MHVVLEWKAQAWFNKTISCEGNISINRQSGEQHSVEAQIGGTALASRKRLCYLQREMLSITAVSFTNKIGGVH